MARELTSSKGYIFSGCVMCEKRDLGYSFWLGCHTIMGF